MYPLRPPSFGTGGYSFLQLPGSALAWFSAQRNHPSVKNSSFKRESWITRPTSLAEIAFVQKKSIHPAPYMILERLNENSLSKGVLSLDYSRVIRQAYNNLVVHSSIVQTRKLASVIRQACNDLVVHSYTNKKVSFRFTWGWLTRSSLKCFYRTFVSYENFTWPALQRNFHTSNLVVPLNF